MKAATAARGEAGRRGQAPRDSPDANSTGLRGHRGPPGAWVPVPILTRTLGPHGAPSLSDLQSWPAGLWGQGGGPRWGTGVLSCSPAREGG